VTARLELLPRPRILVVALRRLGDVLLTTPLIRSLKRAWPDAHIEVLVFANTAAILQGNPDIDDVIGMPQPTSARDSLALAARLWRRYDLAITTQGGDRPSFFAIVAGRKRAGLYEHRLIGRIKRAMLHRSSPMDESVHRVDEVLTLATALGIPAVPELVAPRAPGVALPAAPYAVIHAAPMFRYKQWHREGWRTLAAHLSGKGLAVLASGGPAEEERRFLDVIWQDMPFVQRIDGRLSWPELSATLAGAQVYIGPDTSVTHLAAASGCPTVALFGPTDARRWGPWPAAGLQAPWAASGTIQHRGNVRIVQNPLPCLPCGQEGCLRRLDSYSRCLDELPAAQVIVAVEAALAERR
jgi:heptosyltransferase-3